MIKIKKLRAAGMHDPIGISISQPRLTWYLESDKNDTVQKSYRVIAAKTLEDIRKEKGSFYDSGIVESDKSECVLGRPIFESGVRIYWTACAWDNHGEMTGWGDVQWFETGILRKADWKAKWIEPLQRAAVCNGGGIVGIVDVLSTPAIRLPLPEAELNPCPILRKTFVLDKTVKKARVYATAHGVYQLYLNGSRVGDLEMMPEATPYKDMLQVQTYDITEMLSDGENVIGAILGDGWWSGRVSNNEISCVYGDKLALLLQINIEFDDGTKTVIGSDQSFMTYFGDILYSDIGIGEKVDRRRAVKNWNCSGEVEGVWSPAEVKDYGYDNLCGQNAEPAKVKKILKPIAVKEYEDGTLLIDFGQIVAGNAKIVFDGTDRCGEEILISYCEQVDKNGDFLYNFSAYRHHEDFFTLCGEKEEVYEPKFTWRGFRWIRIKGYGGHIDLDKVEARLIASDVERIAEFTCSDEKITKLQNIIQWTLINNMLSIPTDNPDRERAGWLGDAEMIAATMAYNWDSNAFLGRWLEECRYEQLEDGQIPMIVPNHWKDPLVSPAGWGDAVIIVPWEVYQAYGNKAVLADNYVMMQKWMDFVLWRSSIDPFNKPTEDEPMTLWDSNMDLDLFKDYGPDIAEGRKENFRYIWNADFQFGDWMTPSGNFDEEGNWKYWSTQNNETFYPCYYMAYCSELMVKIAEILEKKSDAEYYASVNAKVKNAVIEEFYNNGYLPNNDFQGVLVLALRAGLYPEGERHVLEERLVQVINQDGGRLNTGFASMEHVMDEIVKAGRADLAYDLLLSDKYPSFTYMIDHDATGLWESWVNIGEDGTVNVASYTQYALGNIGKWLLGGVAGIGMADAGYKKLRIAPVIDPKRRITFAEASLETPNGPAGVSWKVSGKEVELSVHIPVGSTAEIVFLSAEKGVETVGSGDYKYNYLLSSV